MKTVKIILAALALAVLFPACSLEEEVTSYTIRENYYHNAKEIQTGLNSCYSPMRSIYGNVSFFEMTECATDLMYLNVRNQYNAVCNISPSHPGCATTIWQMGYRGVSRANTMIEVIKEAAEKKYISERERVQLNAEAVILRAFFYYVLTATFGDVPFYEEEVTEANRVKIESLPRMSARHTRAVMMDELWKTLMPETMGGQAALPFTRTYDSGDFRVGAAVGLFVGGRMALWNKDWDKAIGFFGQLENIYGELSRYPLTDVPFSQKYTAESIWEVSQTYEPYGLQVTSSIASWTTPVRRMVYNDDEEAVADSTHCFYNGIAIPELGSEAHIYASARPTAFMWETLMTYDSPDLRSGEYSNGAAEARGGSGNLAWRWSGFDPTTPQTSWTEANRRVFWFTSVGKARATPWLGNKFWCWDMKFSRDSNNYKVFRYASALLGLSEAWLMKGDYSECLRYLNMTRRRAGLSDLSTSDVGGNADLMMEEIRNECAKELFGEFQRKFDLVRWGIWYERTTQYNTASNLVDNIRPCHRYWPIPNDQVANSHGALDNKEYEE
ncbi:MAG: RagB/SusD family nutrient uptake outer membrane protein [Bacteroidales bacterium]|nr:RagB/SusD family nutrient uptake outer membrane protein [Bacteroidales bacterium]